MNFLFKIVFAASHRYRTVVCSFSLVYILFDFFFLRFYLFIFREGEKEL